MFENLARCTNRIKQTIHQLINEANIQFMITE